MTVVPIQAFRYTTWPTSKTEMARIICAQLGLKFDTDAEEVVTDFGATVAASVSVVAQAMDNLGWFLYDERRRSSGIYWAVDRQGKDNGLNVSSPAHIAATIVLLIDAVKRS